MHESSPHFLAERDFESKPFYTSSSEESKWKGFRCRVLEGQISLIARIDTTR